MREKIDCFLPCSDADTLGKTLQTLRESKTIQHINLLVTDAQECAEENGSSDTMLPADCTKITVDSLLSTKTMLTIEEHTDAEYVLISLKTTPVDLGLNALERMLRMATDSCAGLVYADSYVKKESGVERHPAIDYQTGSLRDDFDFGQLVLIR